MVICNICHAIEFISICQKEHFQKQIKQAIHSDFFWNNLFNKIIQSVVMEEKSTIELHSNIKSEVEKILPGKIGNKFVEYGQEILPSQITLSPENQMDSLKEQVNTNQIGSQPPDYSNKFTTDSSVHEILNKHMPFINEQVGIAVREIIDHIITHTNDEQICDAHYESLSSEEAKKISLIFCRKGEMKQKKNKYGKGHKNFEHLENLERCLEETKKNFFEDLENLKCCVEETKKIHKSGTDEINKLLESMKDNDEWYLVNAKWYAGASLLAVSVVGFFTMMKS